MHQRKYFTSNFFINEIFSVEKFPNYGTLQGGRVIMCVQTMVVVGNRYTIKYIMCGWR